MSQAVKHFQEQLGKWHNYTLGYTVTKRHLHRSGLTSKAPKRPARRKKRPRRPMVGTMLHQDASMHAGWTRSEATWRRAYPAYSPQARGRSERAFLTSQDRLTKKMKLAGIDTVEGANRRLSETYIADHNRMFAIEAEQVETAFVTDAAGIWRETLCIHRDRAVGNDNTVKWEGLSLQLPTSRQRP